MPGVTTKPFDQGAILTELPGPSLGSCTSSLPVQALEMLAGLHPHREMGEGGYFLFSLPFHSVGFGHCGAGAVNTPWLGHRPRTLMWRWHPLGQFHIGPQEVSCLVSLPADCSGGLEDAFPVERFAFLFAGALETFPFDKVLILKQLLFWNILNIQIFLWFI